MKGLHQGERLLLIANRSGMTRKEIAHRLNIHPGHLSKLFKSELLTSKIKKGASELFDIPISFFETAEMGSVDFKMSELNEPDSEYQTRQIGEMTAGEVFQYWEEKDKRHWEERGRLLAIIENLTKK